MRFLSAILSFLGGGVVNDLAGQLRAAHADKLAAQTSEQKLAADHDMERLSNALEMARVANEDRWSATSIGRYLVVLPFGIYLSLIVADSVFAFAWDVLEMPDKDYQLLKQLFIAIVIGDVGKSIVRSLRR